MRIHPWITAVTGALMLCVAQTPTWGQTPYGGGASPYPPGQPYAPPPPGAYAPYPAGVYPSPAAPGGPADASTLYPANTPNDFQPWPAVSPFQSANVGMDQTYNSNGLWFRELFYRKRRFFTSVEPMVISYRDAGHARIGSPYATPLVPSDEFIWGEFQDPYYGPYVESPNVEPTPTGNFVVDPRIFPVPALSTGTDLSNPLPLSVVYGGIYDAKILGNLNPQFGIQGRFGYENEDHTGMMWTAWWGTQGTSSMNRGYEFINGVRVNQAITLALEGQNLTPLQGLIPLYNGEPFFPYFGPGSTAKYDVLYSLKLTTQAAGSNLSFYEQPIYRAGGIMIRPLWGLRYLYLNEGLRFRGIDSGFNYDVNEETFRPDGGSLETAYSQYEARLDSDVRSNIAGPEVGLRFDLGGPNDGFKMWAESIFGLNANNEQIRLSGDNIGDPLLDVRFNGFLVPRMLDPANDSTFSSQKTTTHVSPLFQQSIFADFDFVDVIPGIREMHLFQDTTLRLGYTFLWVGAVARPADSIKWQGFPLFPQIKSDRQSWWANQFTAAIDWHF